MYFDLRCALKKCSRCKFLYYCDVNCQKNDWKKVHRFECKLYQEDTKREQKVLLKGNFVRLIVRLYLMLDHNPTLAQLKHQTYNGVQRCFNDLIDHSDDLYSSVRRVNFFESVIQKLLTIGLNIDHNLLFSLYGKITINSFAILNISLNKMGTGIYIAASLLDHSCRPNCDAIFDGTSLEIRAMESFDLAKTAPTITYIDLKLNKENRQAKLKEQYFFDCNCSRCSDQTEDTSEEIIEMNKQFDDLISEKNWKQAYVAGLKTLPLYEKIYPTYCSDFTLQLMRLAKVLAAIDSKPSGNGFHFLMNKLFKSILVTHGKDHTLYKHVFLNLISMPDS